jgi:hypothetical protein
VVLFQAQAEDVLEVVPELGQDAGLGLALFWQGEFGGRGGRDLGRVELGQWGIY